MYLLKTWEKQREELARIGLELPNYQSQQLKKRGVTEPVWLHFGGGNLYRGFHAELAQELANQGELRAGIIVCETYDEEIIERAYQPFNNDFIEVVMSENGQFLNKLIASTAQSLYCHPLHSKDYQDAIRCFEQPTLQLVTFTITEKGYGLKNAHGQWLPIVQEDIEKGLENPRHTMSIITALLYRRFLKGALPIAMVSTDNFSQNGRRLKESVVEIAEAWLARGFVPNEFISYLTMNEKVTFPWSMIDRITPNPAEGIKEQLNHLGLQDMALIHTKKQTNMATFVNTEETHYLVIEEAFPNGRPPLEKVGVIFTDRETVDKVDSMKVTTSLNPLHTALAVFGCLLGYTSISAEMADTDLVKLVEGIGYSEGLPVVEHPGIIDPKTFIDEVLTKRLPNPYIPDTPQRIATDTSQKVAIRYGETIKKYVEKTGTAASLTYIPLAIAGWIRYLMAIDDQGNKIVVSPDPLLAELQAYIQPLQIGEQEENQISQMVQPILSNATIFGIDLYDAGIAEKIERILTEMVSGKGAVRQTLQKYVS